MPASRTRSALLALHRALVDAERRSYEKELYRMADAEFLDALINNPRFAWLGALTALIARIDEMQEEDASVPIDGNRDLVASIRKLLAPEAGASEFHRRYGERLQASPEVLVAHGAVMRALATSFIRKPS
jgi:hypothetical protein